MRTAMVGAWVLAVGCGGHDGATTDSGDGHPGACGDVTSIPSLSITGRVRDVDQNWLSGVPVDLEERNWEPATHGSATTGPDGTFTMVATDLPVVEGCWGTAVQFWLSGSTDALAGDKPMNPDIERAYEQGLTEIDVTSIPMILYPSGS